MSYTNVNYLKALLGTSVEHANSNLNKEWYSIYNLERPNSPITKLQSRTCGAEMSSYQPVSPNLGMQLIT